MNRPLPLVAQHGGTIRRCHITIRVTEITKRTIDRAQSISTARHHHARLRCMPGVGPEILAIAIGVTIRQHTRVFIDAANHRRARTGRCSVIRHAKRHGFQALAGLRDGFNIRHTERGFDQHFKADAFGAPHRGFNLRHHHVDGIDVRGCPHFRYQNHVQAWAGFYDIDHVAVHVVGIQTIDPYHHGLAAPVDIVQSLNNVLAGLCLVIGCHRIFHVEENNIRS